MAVGKTAKTGDRARTAVVTEEVPCRKCGKPTRIVKRIKDRALGIAGGMYYSCTVCEYAEKK